MRGWLVVAARLNARWQGSAEVSEASFPRCSPSMESGRSESGIRVLARATGTEELADQPGDES